MEPQVPLPSLVHVQRQRTKHSMTSPRTSASLEERLVSLQEACSGALESLAQKEDQGGASSSSRTGAVPTAELIAQLEQLRLQLVQLEQEEVAEQRVSAPAAAEAPNALPAAEPSWPVLNGSNVTGVQQSPAPVEVDDDYDVEEDELAAMNLDPMLHDELEMAPATAQVSVEDIERSDVLIDEPDDLFDEEAAGTVTGTCWVVCSKARTDRIPRAKKRPTKTLAIQLNDPSCDPNTLVYCLFRYRRNRALVTALLVKLEASDHEHSDSYTMHLCYLMLIEPLATVVERWLIQRAKTSLHFALQVYWFCQAMVEEHEMRPGPRHYKRFLRLQRELQTSVGSTAEQKAFALSEEDGTRQPLSQRGKLRSLERANQALSDALELRTVFYSATAFVDKITAVSTTLCQTEPRSARDDTLIHELLAIEAELPEEVHLPGQKFGTFMRVLNVLPHEARSFSTRERNPYMLYLEVVERRETTEGLEDSASASSFKDRMDRRRSRAAQLRRAILAPGRVTLRVSAKTVIGMGHGVSWTLSKGKKGVGVVIDGQRERHAKHQQRREAATAQQNDPFSVTETSPERTARMQQEMPEQQSEVADAEVLQASGFGEGCAPESWREREERIKAHSHFAPNELEWQLAAVLVKADDDLRQEMFCMHLITLFQSAFRKAGLDALADGLRPYSIQATSSNSGIIEALVDATSIAETKRTMLQAHNTASLEACYRARFDRPESTVTYEEAQRHCMFSVAAYAVVQYVLQLKDRHNGNILIDSSGRLVHIDFAFMLGWAPGGITFEKPGFKLTKDMVDVWGGRNSPLWDEFVDVFVEGLSAIRMQHELIMRDVEVIAACGARFPFLTRNRLPRVRVLKLLRHRFKTMKSPQKFRKYALYLIDEAYDNFWTHMYAKFQLLTNGIPP